MEEIVKYENEELIVADKVIDEMKNLEAIKVQLEIKQKELKQALLDAMKKYNISSWQTTDGTIKAVYRQATTRNTLDTTRIKKERPEIYEEFIKTSDVKESVALTVDI